MITITLPSILVNLYANIVEDSLKLAAGAGFGVIFYMKIYEE
jgi:hypothetical protein